LKINRYITIAPWYFDSCWCWRKKSDILMSKMLLRILRC